MVFLLEDVVQSPVSKPVDIAELALPIEDLLGPFAGQTQGLWEGAHKFYYLCNVVVVFAILGARLWIEEIVAGDELEGLNRGHRLAHA